MLPTRLLAALVALVLVACQEIALIGLVENNNYVTTGRSISGWALSVINDEDCEPMRVFERQPVCQVPLPPPPEPICYRSLAAVTCHPLPDPWMPSGRLLPAPGQLE